MQAYEFQATAQNGIIRIPDEYIKNIGSEVRVILISEDQSKKRKASARRSLNDLVGVLKDCGDVDLQQIRTERLKKYENPD